MVTATQTKKATKKTVKKVVKKKVVKKTKAPAAKKAEVKVKSPSALIKKFSKSYEVKKVGDGLLFKNGDCRSFKAAVDMKNRISPEMSKIGYRCSAVLWTGSTCDVNFMPKG